MNIAQITVPVRSKRRLDMHTSSLHRSHIYPMVRLLAAGILLLGLLGLPPGARAAAGKIFFAIPHPALLTDCSSWAEGCSLQKAITTAAAGDSIYVLMGTYYPGTVETDTFQLKTGVAIYGGFDGDEKTIAERDPVANVTTLSGEIGLGHVADNSLHVVTGSGVDNTAVLDGFTITGGNADVDSTGPDSGGGLYIWSGSPTLNRLIFTSNHALRFDRGGIFINIFADHSLCSKGFGKELLVVLVVGEDGVGRFGVEQYQTGVGMVEQRLQFELVFPQIVFQPLMFGDVGKYRRELSLTGREHGNSEGLFHGRERRFEMLGCSALRHPGVQVQIRRGSHPVKL